MTHRQRCTALLDRLGAVLVRHKRHEIWRLPDGRIHTRSCTPSDHHSDLNNLKDLERQAGIRAEPRKTPSSGREKRAKAKRHGEGRRMAYQPFESAMANALRVSGLVEAELREKIANLENAVVQLRESNDRLRSEMRRCWGCQMRGWWERKL